MYAQKSNKSKVEYMTKALLTLIIISQLQSTIVFANTDAAGTPASAATVSDNPFSAGTGRYQLSADERATLLQYADNARNWLTQALDVARGTRDEEKVEIYLEAIKKVVIASFQDQKRQELILRIALNQALEITVGVPSANGQIDPSRKVLSTPKNSGLMVTILEQSMRLALDYYEDDRFAILKQDLANLPMMRYANSRLQLLTSWNSAVIDMPTSHKFMKIGLQQWFNVAANPNNLYKVTFAEEIVGAEQFLDSLEAQSVQMYPNLLMQQVRALRNKIALIARDTANKSEHIR